MNTVNLMKNSKKALSILLAVYISSFSSASADENLQNAHKEKLISTISKSKETRCAPVIGSTYRAAYKDQSYRLFRLDDLDRKNQIGTLELVSGNGFIYPIQKMNLKKAESTWGKSRDRIVYKSPEHISDLHPLTHRKDSPTLMTDGDKNQRIFDVLALGADNQPKVFHITMLLEQGLYTVDGPGIQQIDYKHVEETGGAEAPPEN
ncbi:MAG TPA: hypothetical protein PKC98_07630 [Candidatus Melainabacteria bacterium]|nr:hypothetical protein [Candidatus Melainabacteria bacterium]